MQEVEIVKAGLRDVPVILEFIHKLASYENLEHEVVADENAIREHLFGDRPVAEAALAKVNGRAVGFALFFTSFSTFLGKPGIYLEDLFVDVEERGKGIGKALLKYLAQLAQDRRYGRVEWAVLNWNEPSIAFYQGLGARPQTAWTTYRLAGEALREMAQ